MAFLPQPRATILTPCIGICRLGNDGFCEGCHRTGDEIAAWLTYSDEQRRRLVIEILPQRALQRRR